MKWQRATEFVCLWSLIFLLLLVAQSVVNCVNDRHVDSAWYDVRLLSLASLRETASTTRYLGEYQPNAGACELLLWIDSRCRRISTTTECPDIISCDSLRRFVYMLLRKPQDHTHSVRNINNIDHYSDRVLKSWGCQVIKGPEYLISISHLQMKWCYFACYR